MTGFFNSVIGNTVSALRVGYISHSRFIILPSNKLSRQLLNKLVDCGVISHFSDYRCNVSSKLSKRTLYGRYVKIFLSYIDGKPVPTAFRLLSKPSARYYITYNVLQRYMLTRRGILLISTSRGILTAGEAVNIRVGGCLLLWVLL